MEEEKFDSERCCNNSFHEPTISFKSNYCKTENLAFCPSCPPDAHTGHLWTSSCVLAKNIVDFLEIRNKKKEAEIEIKKKQNDALTQIQSKKKAICEEKQGKIAEIKSQIIKIFEQVEKELIAEFGKEMEKFTIVFQKSESELKETQVCLNQFQEELTEVKKHRTKFNEDCVEIYNYYRKYEKEIAEMLKKKDSNSPKKQTPEENFALVEEAKRMLSEVNIEKFDTDPFHFEEFKKKLYDAFLKLSKSKKEQTSHPLLITYEPLASDILIHDLFTSEWLSIKLILNGKEITLPSNAGITESDGCFYITGGRNGSRECMNSSYRYAILAERLIELDSMIQARSEHSVIFFRDKLICVGGINGNNHLKSCEELSTNPYIDNKWKPWKGELNEEKSFPSLCIFTEKNVEKLYCFGGTCKGKLIGTIESIIISSEERWQIINLDKNDLKEKAGLTSIAADDENILIFGGYSRRNESNMQTFKFNVAKKTVELISNADLVEPLDLTGVKPAYFKKKVLEKGKYSEMHYIAALSNNNRIQLLDLDNINYLHIYINEYILFIVLGNHGLNMIS